MDSVDSAAPSPQHGLRVVGVLGGVGSGKSTAARFLAQALAAPHLDALLPHMSALLAAASGMRPVLPRRLLSQ